MKRNTFSYLPGERALIALVGGTSGAQQGAPVDIRQLVPPNSVLAVAFDLGPDNPEHAGLAKAEDSQTQEIREKQRAGNAQGDRGFRHPVRHFAGLRQDIQSWVGDQYAVVILPRTRTAGSPCL